MYTKNKWVRNVSQAKRKEFLKGAKENSGVKHHSTYN